MCINMCIYIYIYRERENNLYRPAYIHMHVPIGGCFRMPPFLGVEPLVVQPRGQRLCCSLFLGCPRFLTNLLVYVFCLKLCITLCCVSFFYGHFLCPGFPCGKTCPGA